MIAAAALALAPGAAPDLRAPRDDSLVAVFRRVCLEGSGRFQPGEVAPTGLKSLPAPVRSFLRQPSRLEDSFQADLGPAREVVGRYFRVRAAGGGFLAVETVRRGGVDHQRCTLASRALEFEASIRRLEEKPRLQPDGWYGRALFTTYSWATMSSLGYRLVVSKLGGDYVALQTLLLPPDEVRRQIESINARRRDALPMPAPTHPAPKEKSQ